MIWSVLLYNCQKEIHKRNAKRQGDKNGTELCITD